MTGAGAARTITEECERLFCETLRGVFLGEKMAPAGSHVIGREYYGTSGIDGHSESDYRGGVGYGEDLGMTPPSDRVVDRTLAGMPQVVDYIEVWDYVGGARFRGFTAISATSVGIADEDDSEKTMFIFFDEIVLGRDLKKGYASRMFEACDGNANHGHP